VAAEERQAVLGHREGLGMIYNIKLLVIGILVGINTYQFMMATDKQDKIIHLLWVIIFMIGVLEK
jgi:hypothetical protein